MPSNPFAGIQPPADAAGGWQSAESFVAQLVASRFPPNVSAELGRNINRVRQIRNLLEGDSTFVGTPLSLLGGISIAEARERYNQYKNISYARKNFFIVNVEHPNPGNFGLTAVSLNKKVQPAIFDFFAIEAEYSPVTINSDERKIGMTSFDEITGTERTELRLTALDNSAGSLKEWFRDRASIVADSKTGLGGLPADYLLRFTIYHACVTDPGKEAENRPYIDTYNMRPTSMSFDLSRREPGIQEIQLVFTQMDSFMTPGSVDYKSEL